MTKNNAQNIISQDEKLEEYRKKVAEQVASEFETQFKELGLISPEAGARYGGRTSIVQKSILGSVKQEDLADWLKNPHTHEKQLRELSNLLINISGEYRSMVNYLKTQARFYHVIKFKGDTEEYKNNEDKKRLKSQLKTLSEEHSKMNIKHEFAKIFDTVLREDVFYGYEIEDKNSFFFLPLKADHCRLSGMSNGMWTFQFDFSYFKGKEYLLDSYPSEFRERYNAYTNRNDNRLRWQPLDQNKSVCFKYNETSSAIIPPLSSTFEGLLELTDYRRFKKANTKINNYLLLHQKVPMFKDTDKTQKVNNFAIDSKTTKMFHRMLDESLPEEIGAVISPMEIEPIQLNKQGVDTSDRVAEATRDIYNAAGINQFLFNPDKNSTAGLSKSIQKDEMMVISFYSQVGRWLNKKKTVRHPTYKDWEINLLATTGLSEEKYADFLIKLGTLGFPVVGAIASMVDMNILEVESMSFLENDVLNLKEKMVPFASSHTGGANESEGRGRPQKSDTEISDSGQANKDSNQGVTGGGEQ